VPGDATRWQIDVIVNGEVGFEAAIKEFKRRNADVMRELKRRRRDGPERRDRRRNQRYFRCKTGSRILYTGQYRSRSR
jgi:hypothetical protein